MPSCLTAGLNNMSFYNEYTLFTIGAIGQKNKPRICDFCETLPEQPSGIWKELRDTFMVLRRRK